MTDPAAGDVVLTDVSKNVATITLNRPGRRNALSSEVIRGLLDSFAAAKSDDGVRVVVVTGAGDKAFCAGGDLGGGAAPATFAEAHAARGAVADVFRAVYALGKPTIAKVRGYALAGGFGIALMCDFVVAADDAVFGTPEINVGMYPMMITAPMLRSMAPKVALDLQLTGRRVSAEEGHRLGFVTEVVAPDRLDEAVAERADVLASKPGAIMALGRDAFYRVLDQSMEDALAYLHGSLSLVMQTEDHREGIKAFLEKRAPVWTGQ
ncbi:enoyl-CoA hydratase/isomerase family protein [[Mycobacterium] nativiensis]|uniref:Enoyl-CoA hydratase-related protein n=1 Tax=[Mycobacterium] nativiensis TaxID=2855503 RepID=A0ABU5XV48_9MYCO|nr:enoyl-CoA hydratase-related protein [Mycolicibacter sp. MYC340]MEB3031862.1 enoyl-CoA hydratase-related protein [Mycolicibacter sp. MYC340]